MWRSQICVVVCFAKHTNIFSERNQTSLSIFENCQCMFMSLARGALRPGRKGGTQPLIYFGTQICRWTSAWTYNYVKTHENEVHFYLDLFQRVQLLMEISLLLQEHYSFGNGVCCSPTPSLLLSNTIPTSISTPVRSLFSETQTQALHSDGQRASHEDL